MISVYLFIITRFVAGEEEKKKKKKCYRSIGATAKIIIQFSPFQRTEERQFVTDLVDRFQNRV